MSAPLEHAEQAVTVDRTAILREAADAITAVIDADKARFPARSNDRAALGRAREIVLGLIGKPPAGAVQTGQVVDQVALIREAIDRLETRARQAPAPGARLHSFRDVAHVLIAELRDMADEAPRPEAQAVTVSPTAALLASRCDTCLHTLNRHSNYAGCTVVLCVCGRFQPPVDEKATTTQPGKEA